MTRRLFLLCAVGRSGVRWLNDHHSLDVQADADISADQYAAGFQGAVPGQAEFFAVDFRRCSKADTCIAKRTLDLPEEFYVEHDRQRFATNGQIALHFGGVIARQVNAGAFESD